MEINLDEVEEVVVAKEEDIEVVVVTITMVGEAIKKGKITEVPLVTTPT